MPVTLNKLNTFQAQYACDECSEKPNPGCILEFTGMVKASMPPFYQHQCPSCKKCFDLKNKYPDIVYLPVKE